MTRAIAKLLIGLLDASTFYVLRGDGDPGPQNGPFADVGPQCDRQIDRNTEAFVS
jgi:hypothetical protein